MNFVKIKRTYTNQGYYAFRIILAYILLSLSGCGGSSYDSNDDDSNNYDTTAPVITIIGDNPASVDHNGTYTDEGATANDNTDGAVNVTTTGSVDTTMVGSYTITYTAADAAGNESSATRTVNVVDITPPVITIVGDNPAMVILNDVYTDAGATAIDDIDGSLMVTTSGAVDTSMAGAYIITYTAADAAGNESMATRTVNVSAASLSGTAAAGAAIVGTVTVKGSLGLTTSTLIEADGNYNIDVSGLTAPYRIRAQGTVGGKTYKIFSYAEESDLGNTVNITPFTDLIIANAAQQIAESFFDSDMNTSLDAEDIAAQETALQAKLQDVFDALGLDAAINLLNTTFSADHSGLDAALDIIQIESTSANIVTITNLLDGSSITDDITDADDNDQMLPVDADAVTEAVSDIQAIANIFSSFSALYAEGLPASTAIEDFFSDDFLELDAGKGEFLTEMTTDPTLVGLGFSNIAITNLDSDTGTANVSFNVFTNSDIDPETVFWLAGTDEVIGWQLRGDQRIVDLESIAFHCNDNNGFDEQTGGCGINVAIWDENFNNNDTGGEAISSATATIIDSDDGQTVKDIIYLGNPDWASAGELQVYNEATGVYQGDWKGFGSAAGEIDPDIFVSGDMVYYSIYTQDLDLSDPQIPMVSTGNEIATYNLPILHAPETTGSYPALDEATLMVIENYTLGDNLTLNWVLAEGTVSDEILIQVSDTSQNRIEIWDESFTSNETSTTISTAAIEAAILDNPDFDADSNGLMLLIRVYSIVATTGQIHSTDYQVDLVIEQPNPDLVCGYESGWDDSADDGLGAPINPNSFADYQTVVADCGGGMTFSVEDVAGKTFNSDGDVSSFLDDGSGTEADPSSGSITPPGEDAILFNWYVEQASNMSYLVMFTNSTIDTNLPVGFSIRETSALTGITGTKGTPGAVYIYVKYSEGSNYGDMNREVGSDGEIWSSTDTLQ